MSDGNTTTQADIGPEAKEAMGMFTKFQEAFAYASNVIVEASKMRGELGELRSQLDGLRGEVETLRRSNLFFDEQVTKLRMERDASGLRVHELEMTLHERNGTITVLESKVENLQFDVKTVREEIRDTREERDAAQLRVMELEEELSKQDKFVKDITLRLEEVSKVLRPQATQVGVGKVEPPPTQQEVEAQFAEILQGEGETTEAYVARVGRYPSEREARAAAQPRAETGQFVAEDPIPF